VAILGVGEAGSCIAEDLVARGLEVRAWDPAPGRQVEGVSLAAGAAEAVAGSDVVLSLNSASAALDAARSAVPGLASGVVYADLNTAAPRIKRDLAELVAPSGAFFADVALMSSVPGRGVRTPALVSGTGAAEFARLFEPLGMPVEVVEGEAGAAASRKLLRSVFMKGLAAALVESLRAAEAAGCGPWLRGDLVRVLEGAGEPLLDRLVTGSSRHAVRRAVEMEAACELLEELGVEPRVATAARGWLEELAAEAAGVA
jgi:3-hydroxyisobutyrate dehydrogenase-like beta-hydroxyacid dehydrogenase